MAHDYNIAVFIGRFQPFHNGHLSVILEGLERADHLVVLVGSAGSPRCHRNPFTFDERSRMIRESIPAHLRNRVRIKPLEDAAYNDSRWIHRVQSNVTRAAWEFGYTNEPNTALIGHSKDHSSYYLKLFPQWGSIDVPNCKNINSTRIRNAYFSNIVEMWLSDSDGHKIGDLPQGHIVTPEVRLFLIEFINTPAYKIIKDEYEFILKYRASWAVAPYPVNLVCVDAVVIKSGHVLMIERGAYPGKGQMALPGGYLNVNERAVDGMIRELREETGLKVPDKVLRGSIKSHDIFDNLNRSSRGRVITIAYLIDLGKGPLDKVKGSDDAAKAQWIPLSNLKRDEIFEDHIDIIAFLTGV
jgi:bifunctional NMN adenylyltransferase/nudix hydrolase